MRHRCLSPSLVQLCICHIPPRVRWRRRCYRPPNRSASDCRRAEPARVQNIVSYSNHHLFWLGVFHAETPESSSTKPVGGESRGCRIGRDIRPRRYRRICHAFQPKQTEARKHIVRQSIVSRRRVVERSLSSSFPHFRIHFALCFEMRRSDLLCRRIVTLSMLCEEERRCLGGVWECRYGSADSLLNCCRCFVDSLSFSSQSKLVGYFCRNARLRTARSALDRIERKMLIRFGRSARVGRRSWRVVRFVLFLFTFCSSCCC